MTATTVVAITVPCSCWCELETVAIPVEFVSEGRTIACDLPDCEPGCPSRATDAFDEHFEEPNTTGPPQAAERKRIMTHDYDPRADSSPGVPDTVRDAYPGLILEIAEGTCNCGCGAKRSAKARFIPGHDAKLKGKLQRALAAGVSVHEIGGDGEVNTTPPLSVARFYGWEEIVQKGADRIIARSQTPIAAEKRLFKLTEDGRPGWTLLEKSRWEQTGRLLTIWANDETGTNEAMYVTPDGQIETFETSKL